MKAYAMVPVFDLADPEDRRVQACIDLVTRIVCEHLRRGGERFLHALDWRNPGDQLWRGWSKALAEPHIVNLGDPADLMRMVGLSINPFSGGSATVIRSIATCRAVTFGFDGQVFLCLRHEDDPPVSPGPELVVVDERPELLTATDYFDGWLRGPERSAS